ncbi:MAG TPA: SRPBCC family protein [Wenzhouxiangella sp.]|nr:SRPBCC family protein [Wenzhouxiangella sp.]
MLLRRTFGVLLATAVLVVFLGFFLPRTTVVERSLVIDQPLNELFEVLQDLRHFPHWAPWLEQVPEDNYRFEGPESGVGATLVWSDQAGGGRLWITDVVPGLAIDLQMELGETQSATYFRVEPLSTDGQRVTWGLQVEARAYDLVGRYMSLILPGLVGPEFDRGLARLADYLNDPLAENLGSDDHFSGR